jgi:hypothetical protein
MGQVRNFEVIFDKFKNGRILHLNKRPALYTRMNPKKNSSNSNNSHGFVGLELCTVRDKVSCVMFIVIETIALEARTIYY